MKQKHFFAVCKTRFLSLLTVLTLLFTLGIGNAWGADTELTFSLTSNPGGWPTSNSTTLTNYTYTLSGTNYTFALKNVKCNSGYLMLTSTAVLGLPKISDKKLTKVVVSNSSGCSTSTRVGISSSSSSDSYITGGAYQTYSSTSSNYTYNLSETSNNTMYYLYITNKNCQITQIKLTYSGDAPATSVSASPNSIIFDGVELDPEDGAEGSKTTTITLSNGYASYGNYLYGWFEDVSDEDHCEFFVNSASTYSYTTSGSATPTLTLSYLADAAGTFTGNFIIQGYNSSYTAVNCTIPLSVTITAPACANQVTLTKGAQTNGTYTLSSANGSYDNCLSNFVVTVSSISPSSGYACTGVTATGGNSSVSGPDGSGNYTVTYTKGNTISSTVTANFAAKVATPTFSPAAGTYTGAQNVTISCETAGATIYYTTNGSTPTTSSSVYSSPISVAQGTTIKAFATKAGMPNSDVATAAYVIRYTVSWSVNGTAYSSPVVVTCGSTTSTPADPTPSGDCAGLVFRGWTATANYEHATDAPGNMFNSTTPPITGDITFHAIFAEEDDEDD